MHLPSGEAEKNLNQLNYEGIQDDQLDFLIKTDQTDNCWQDLGIEMDHDQEQSYLDFDNLDLDELDRNISLMCQEAFTGQQTPVESDSCEGASAIADNPSGQEDMSKIISKLVEMEKQTEKVKVPDDSKSSKAFLLSHYLEAQTPENSEASGTPERVKSGDITENARRSEEEVKENEMPKEARTSRSGRLLKRKRPLSDVDSDPSDNEWTGGAKPKKQISKKRLSTEEEKEAHKITRPKAHIHSKGKRRLYEFANPFRDPKMEKKRLDAINAKANRDRAKKEREVLSAHIDMLRKEIERLQESEEKWKRRALLAEAALELHGH